MLLRVTRTASATAAGGGWCEGNLTESVGILLLAHELTTSTSSSVIRSPSIR